MSRVYDVTLALPSVDESSTDPHIEATREPDFCLKVVCDEASFAREIEALNAVEPKFYRRDLLDASSRPGASAVGPHLPKVDSRTLVSAVESESEANGSGISSNKKRGRQTLESRAVKASSDESKSAHKEELQNIEPWWDVELRVSFGGVVPMALGREVTVEEWTHEATKVRMLNDCVECLRRMHDAGYCHTDIRRDNIIHLRARRAEASNQCDEEYCLVDFGEAVRAGSSVDLSDRPHTHLLPLSALVFGAGGATGANDFAWRREHDVEQLTRTLLFSSAACEAGLKRLVARNKL
jgi:hypothetical protein